MYRWAVKCISSNELGAVWKKHSKPHSVYC